MKVDFTDKSLALIETDRAGNTQLPVGVIKAARRKLTVLRAAPDERTLLSWKSLHYVQLKGGRDGQCSIQLNDQFQMAVELNKKANPLSITILGIKDYQ
jgi:proteic killer suppression protein